MDDEMWRKKIEREQEEKRQKELQYAQRLIDIVNVPIVRELLEETGTKITLFEHYNSSIGAAFCSISQGKKVSPTFELVLDGEGLTIKRYGDICKQVSLDAGAEAWKEIIPYDSKFWDSSRGEVEFDGCSEVVLLEARLKVREMIRSYRTL